MLSSKELNYCAVLIKICSSPICRLFFYSETITGKCSSVSGGVSPVKAKGRGSTCFGSDKLKISFNTTHTTLTREGSLKLDSLVVDMTRTLGLGRTIYG